MIFRIGKTFAKIHDFKANRKLIVNEFQKGLLYA